MYINLTWNCRVCVGVAFLCLLCAFLSSLTTLEWVDQQHFAKTKMGYISLPSKLNAIIGTSYYCVILKMVILHDAIKTIHNGNFVFFWEQKAVSFLNKTKISELKKTKKAGWVIFFKKRVFLNPDCLSILYMWFSLDRTIWNKSRHYQFVWVCTAHLEYRSLVLKNVRITGISIRKN